MKECSLKCKKGFTLAEVLITVAIIGVVAAISIPSVISNSQQQEFKTGLRKAVSVLNSAITMNMALDGESPYDNQDLFNYLQRHMNIMKTAANIFEMYASVAGASDNHINGNAVFYTTDGMRFEFSNQPWTDLDLKLHENSNIYVCSKQVVGSPPSDYLNACHGCGSYGLNNNPDNTTKPPCLITVDVNGDRKPNPGNINCKVAQCAKDNVYKLADIYGIKLTDVFSIMITDKQAIPYGIAAQKAIYQARK